MAGWGGWGGAKIPRFLMPTLLLINENAFLASLVNKSTNASEKKKTERETPKILIGFSPNYFKMEL